MMTKYYLKVDVAKKRIATYISGQTDSMGNSLDGKKVDLSTSPVTVPHPNAIISMDCDEKMTPDFNTITHLKGGIKTFMSELAKGNYTLHTVVGTKTSFPTPSTHGFYIDPAKWKLLKRNIEKHVNTMLIGPTGCGKTSIVKLICKELGLPLYIFDMGACTDPISTLLGVHRLQKGESIFDYAKFTQVIQEPCVILLDELSRSSIGSNNILFPCLDDRRTLNVDIAGSTDVREIKVNPEVTFISTANIGSEYTGTNTMDAALVDRFFPIELGMIPEIQEAGVLEARVGIERGNAALIVKVANTIRSLARKGDISRSVSIRETLMISSLLKDGWSIGDALKAVLLPLYEGTETDGERSLVYKTIATY